LKGIFKPGSVYIILAQKEIKDKGNEWEKTKTSPGESQHVCPIVVWVREQNAVWRKAKML
jgi:hypothetical protein